MITSPASFYYIGVSEDVSDLVSGDIRNKTLISEAVLASGSSNLEPLEAGARKTIVIDIFAAIDEGIFAMESVGTILIEGSVSH